MDYRLKLKKGFTLLELVIVLAIVGVILSIVLINGSNSINRARVQQTIREMQSIAQAAVDNYASSNNPNDASNPQAFVWASTTSSLSGAGDVYYNNLPQNITTNPYGNQYVLVSGNNMITVQTVVPSGVIVDPSEGSFLTSKNVAGGQQISITESVPNEFTGRLIYDNNFLYKD